MATRRGSSNMCPGEMRVYVGYQGYSRANVMPGHPYFQYGRHPDAERQASRGNFLHRLVVAHNLGRQLLPSETVHHIDGDRSNNTLDNLQLRHGAHGKGVVVVCADCGSHNTVAVNV